MWQQLLTLDWGRVFRDLRVAVLVAVPMLFLLLGGGGLVRRLAGSDAEAWYWGAAAGVGCGALIGGWLMNTLIAASGGSIIVPRPLMHVRNAVGVLLVISVVGVVWLWFEPGPA